MTRRRQLKLTTPAEVRKALARVANMVLNGELDTKTANCIIVACNAILSGIRLDEQEKRLDALEALLNEKSTGTDMRVTVVDGETDPEK